MAASPYDEPASGAGERSLRILGLLADHGRPMSLEELGSRMSLSKPSVQRLCANLVNSGFVVRDVAEQSYALGPALQEMAVAVLRHGDLRSQRHAVLKNLSAQIGETCNFATLDGVEVLYLDRVELKRPLRLSFDVGSHVPIHCTSSGKLLLAHLPKALRDDVIHHLPLPRMTANTITEPAALLADCKAIVKRGFSRDDEEFVAGLISVAVPVRDLAGVVRATVSVHAPMDRLSLQQAEARLGLLQEAAQAMGRLI